MAPVTARLRYPWGITPWALFGVTITAVALWLVPWGGSTGTLEIHIKDHREAIDDFAALELRIKTIRLGSRPSVNSQVSEWRDLNPQVMSLDLTQLTGKKTLRVFRGELKPETFQAVHLDLSQLQGTLKDNPRPVPIDNRIGPIRMPLSIDSSTVSRIVLDLVVLDISDHPPGGYELHIKGYEFFKGGQLIDKVPPG